MTQLALTSVQYVQALGTATFAGAVLAVRKALFGRPQLLSDTRRSLMAFGVVALALSLVSGFVNIEMIIETADQGLVHAKLSDLRLLRVLQSLFLLGGVTTVGGALVWNVVSGKGQ